MTILRLSGRPKNGVDIKFMEFKQATIGEIIDSEKEMALTGAQRYGKYFINAAEFNALLNNFIKSIDDPFKYIFVAFLSQVRLNATLALFSSVRLHHVQAGLNLRQLLESGAWAAYAMGNAEKEKFCEVDGNEILGVPERLKKARDAWLTTNFELKSEEIRRLKKIINDSVAHSNIVYAFQNFESKLSETGFHTPFFDFDDEYKVKSDLWFLANILLGLMDLFYGVNQQYKVFQLRDDFLPVFRNLVDQNNRLKAEMMAHPRTQKSLAKNGENHG